MFAVRNRIQLLVAVASLTAACDDSIDELADTGDTGGDDVTAPDSGDADASPDAATDSGSDAADIALDGSGDPDVVDGPEIPEGCNPLAYDQSCFFPFPSDFFLRTDGDNGPQVVISGAARLFNDQGSQVDLLGLHPANGFGVAPIIAAYFPGEIDEEPLTTYADDWAETTGPSSRTLLIDAETLTAVEHFAELDRSEGTEERRVLFIRPMFRLENDRRYIVAIQGLEDIDGSEVFAPDGFARLRDGETAGIPALEQLVDHFAADVFAPLEEFGVERDALTLAWDFTTRTEDDAKGDMFAIRDMAMEVIDAGDVPYSIDAIETGEAFATAEPEMSVYIETRVEGHLTVPRYVDNDEPGAMIFRGDDGRPTQNGTANVPFTILIPRQRPVETKPLAPPFRFIQFGHGFFGSRREIESDVMVQFAYNHGFVLGAVDWWGMEAPDQGPVVGSLSNDPSRTFVFTDRLHQGFVNALAFGRAAKTSLLTDGAFNVGGVTTWAPEDVYFYGISQGHILGGTYLALSSDIKRAILSVGGASFVLMMSRAQPFERFLTFIRFRNSDPIDVAQFIAMSATTLERIDPITYAPYVLGGEVDRRVLMYSGNGDSSVPNVATHFHARALGLKLLTPTFREIEGLDTYGLGDTEADISALLDVDFGIDTAPESISRIPDEATCVHGAVRALDIVQAQISRFLRTDGAVIFPCGAEACASSCDE
jgi:hypothetical protein